MDGRALVPAGTVEAAVDREIREEFGVEDPIVAVVETGDPGGVFNPRTLAHVVALTEAFGSIPGVLPGEVLSLATEPGDRVLPGTFEFPPWLDRVPADGKEMEALRRSLDRARVYRGTLLSIDSPPRATAVLVEVGPDADRAELCRRARAAVLATDVAGDRVLLVGAPVAENELGANLSADLALLVPLAFAVMGAILYLFFRRLAIVALALSGAGASILATLGLMGWCGAPVYLTCLVLPVFLTAVGVAAAVHVLDRTFQFAEGALDTQAALRAAFAELSRPMLHAALTTALGFLSFAFSSLPAVRVLGLSMAAGTLLGLAWSLSALPAALVLLGRRAVPGAGDVRALRGKLSPWISSWTRATLARPALALLPVVLLAVAAALGASRARVQDSWIDGLSPESELARATARVDELFGGTNLLRVRLEAEAVRASGVASREAFDARSFAVDGVLADPPTRLLHHRVALRAAGQESRPQIFRVIGAALENGRTRLALESSTLPKVPVTDLLPAGAAAIAWELSAEERWTEVPMLQELRAFEAFLAGREASGVGAVIGPWSHFSTLYAMMGTGEEEQREVFRDPRGVTRTLDLYLKARGERRLGEVLSRDRNRALVTALVRQANFVSVGALLRDLRAYEREHLAPLGVRLAFGGDLALSQAMISGIVTTQAVSILLSIASVVAVVALLARSIAAGFLCALPCALAVLFVYGIMGWCAIPVGVATSMFAGMAIGVGDDFAIHLWQASRGAREEGSRAAGDAGPAIVVDALAVGAGFSVLLFSRVPTNARLGLLLVLAILGCLAVTLHVLPVLLGRSRTPDR